MNEVRIYGALLLVMLVAAYVSWTSEDDGADTSEVTLWSIEPEQLERVELMTTTQTVAFSYRDDGDDRYGVFAIDNRGKEQLFVANDESEELIKKFAPLTALRSLGRNLADEELEATGLVEPKRRLTITAAGETRVFDVGGRTHGSRDHYVRPRGSEEVVLLAARQLRDLEFPRSKYMQRDLLVRPIDKVAGAVIAANGKAVDLEQKNFLDRKNAYWAIRGEDEPREELGSFLLKLSRLSIRAYPTDLTEFEKAAPILEVNWMGPRGQSLGTTSLFKTGEGDTAKYFARSSRTVRPGEVARVTAAALEKDLPSLIP